MTRVAIHRILKSQQFLYKRLILRDHHKDNDNDYDDENDDDDDKNGCVFSQGGQVDCDEFQDPKVFCTRESNPHCGSDGHTYGNKCAFCKAMVKSGGKISLKHQGKC
ncbi:serine protease inhibitor Kazal-type 6-like [Trichechus manatus latirostris]|uniref:Serine protease inhibitor Kazal-type 6-like n=1 Tax=Trichechus manatus latirostris TaxID=127582 RepID=A0A2Y9RIC3_TRIMA|nr:serine protease inhibitor Kazal-type 6-like [Trichechus manatus latirostris]